MPAGAFSAVSFIPSSLSSSNALWSACRRCFVLGPILSVEGRHFGSPFGQPELLCHLALCENPAHPSHPGLPGRVPKTLASIRDLQLLRRVFRTFSSSKPRFGSLFARDADDLEVEASDDPETFVSTFISPSSSIPRFSPIL